MKCRKLTNYVSAVIFATGLPLGVSSLHAAPASGSPLFAQVEIHVPGIRIEWKEDNRRKLRHAYWILEQGSHDYHGHRAAAMEAVRKAAKTVGMELHGDGYGGERIHFSDEHLRQAREILKDLEHESGEHEREHLRSAIHELDRALEEH